MPPSDVVSWSRCSNSSFMRGSSPEVGSSRIKSSGLCMKASTIPTFWRFPVDSSFTGRSSERLKRSASPSARPVPSITRIRANDSTWSLAVMRGNRASSPGRYPTRRWMATESR